MNTTPQRRIDDRDAEKRRELARIAAEWGRTNYPAPPVVVRTENGRGLLDRFPWEQQ